MQYSAAFRGIDPVRPGWSNRVKNAAAAAATAARELAELNQNGTEKGMQLIRVPIYYTYTNYVYRDGWLSAHKVIAAQHNNCVCTWIHAPFICTSYAAGYAFISNLQLHAYYVFWILVQGVLCKCGENRGGRWRHLIVVVAEGYIYWYKYWNVQNFLYCIFF